ncbi:hypothetical protein ACIQ6K_24670 [Streptomyces sp. NPDC096354]|uniref:hypothetical protein n=1 Tax=Streptomyces sp. NPDC096354 TaxID=3366088 RepID=UPI0037FA7619
MADGAGGGDGDGKPSVQVTPGAAPACLQGLYAELDEALTSWGEDDLAPLPRYIAYRRMVNLASVIFRPKHEVTLVYLRVDPDTVELEGGSRATCAVSATSGRATWRRGLPRRPTSRRRER